MKSATVSIVSPSIYYEVMEPDAMILVFWMLSFKPTFSHSSFTSIKRLFFSSSLAAVMVESSAYLRLLIFLLEILFPACVSSSLAFISHYVLCRIDVFFFNSLPFSMIQWMLAIWSLFHLPFLNPSWASGSSWFTYCWSLTWRILGITLLVCSWVQLCGSLNILWHCLSLRLE